MITDIKNVALNPNRAMDNVVKSRSTMGSFFRNYVKKVEVSVCCGIIIAIGFGLVESLITGNINGDREDRGKRGNGQR